MSLYGTAVRKPVSTALVFVAIVIFGLFSLSRLSVDLLPEIDTAPTPLIRANGLDTLSSKIL